MSVSLSSLRWQYRNTIVQEDTPAQAWLQIGGHPVVAKLLRQRGYESLAAAEAFLSPARSQTNNPLNMKGMGVACDRLEQALKKSEKICLYGDYDVDGVSSVALLYVLLAPYSPHISYYIPDRHSEGYGISLQGVTTAKETGTQLLIALDCGVSDLKAAAAAKHQGIDLIICDHHLPGPELPTCVALLNPRQPGCPYPEKALSGAALGFKLMQGLAIRGLLEEEALWKHSDLVALSLVADQIPLVGESRALVCEGLRRMQQQPRPGLLALMEKMDCRPSEINTHTIGYRLAPPLNAAGRMDHAHKAVELLIAPDTKTAEIAAEALLSLNLARRAAQNQATQEAEQALKALPPSDYSTFLYQEGWHPGVIGIVAARCMEHTARPTLILTKVEERLVGSMRSIEPIDAHAVLKHCSKCLLHFGGHRYAAGCSLAPEQLPALKKAFTTYIALHSKGLDLRPTLWIDMPLAPPEADQGLYEHLQRLSPYGEGNPIPVFCASNLRALPGSVQLLREKHLRFRLPGPQGHSHEAIGFHMGKAAKTLAEGAAFHMAYELQQNHFEGTHRLQLHIKDLIFD